MNRGIDRAVCLFAGYCFTLAVAATCLMQIARAQDAVPPGPPPEYQLPRARVIINRTPGPGVIIDTREIHNGGRHLKLSRLFTETENDGERPLIVAQASATECPAAEHPVCNGCVDPATSELVDRTTRALRAEFGNGGVRFQVIMPHPGQFFEKPCDGPTCCEEMLSHMGGRLAVVEHPMTNMAAKFIRLGCPCTAAGECACASQATCGQDCAATKADSCKCCRCAAEAAIAANEKGGEPACGRDCEVETLVVHHAEHESEDELATEYHPLKLMHHIANLVGEKAAAQAALAVRNEADEEISELTEAMADLLADNAALDAKLDAQNEAHAQQRKLQEKIIDLAAENARLKAHVELAAERAEVARASAAVALENERLKLRVAELEQKLIPGVALAEAARTAVKPVYSRVKAKYPDGRVEIAEEDSRTAAKPKERKAR